MTWKDAILQILQQNKKGDMYLPMHYREITDAIFENGLISPKGKKTPAHTVSATLTQNSDLFESLGGGEYKLTEKGEEQFFGGNSKKNLKEPPKAKEDDGQDEQLCDAKLIKSYGMYWKRDYINWQGKMRNY